MRVVYDLLTPPRTLPSYNDSRHCPHLEQYGFTAGEPEWTRVFTETKKQSPNAGARANNTLHK